MLSVSPSPNIRSFNYQHSWYRSQFPSLPKCIDVASSRALSNPYSRYIGVLGIGVLIIRVFNFYLFLVPGRFFKILIPPRGCDILFFVRQRPESNKPATRRGEREREKERGKKETEMRQRCSARRTLPPFILPNIPVTNPFALEHNFQSGRDPFTTLFLLLLLHLSGEDRKERKENKGGGSSCTRTLLAR